MDHITITYFFQNSISRVTILNEQVDDLTILNVTKGFRNPSLARRLELQLTQFANANIILILHGTFGTEVGGRLIEHNFINAKGNKKIIVIKHGDIPIKLILPNEMVASCIIEALVRFGKWNLITTLPYKYFGLNSDFSIGSNTAILTNKHCEIPVFDGFSFAGNIYVYYGDDGDIHRYDFGESKRSNIHANIRIRLADGQWFIQKRTNEQELLVNDHNVQATKLKHGDSIAIENETFFFLCFC